MKTLPMVELLDVSQRLNVELIKHLNYEVDHCLKLRLGIPRTSLLWNGFVNGTRSSDTYHRSPIACSLSNFSMYFVDALLLRIASAT